jgi:hypothetical protein
MIHPDFFVIPVGVLEGRFGASALGDVVLQVVELAGVRLHHKKIPFFINKLAQNITHFAFMLVNAI